MKGGRRAGPPSANGGDPVCEAQDVLADPVSRTIFESSGTAMLVVDAERRIVAANALARKAAHFDSEAELFGRFFGDVLCCANTADPSVKCGESPACRSCGGMKALEDSLELGRRSEGECLVSRSRGGIADAAELYVIAAPIDIGGRKHVLVSLRDISDEKRRRTLERIFVHDLNNIVASLSAWTDLLDDPDPVIRADTAVRVKRLTEKVVEELRSHSLLTRVESAEFSPSWKEHSPEEVLEQVALSISLQGASGDLVEIARPLPAEPLVTDLTLLLRVLVNMARNAAEAAPRGPIRLGCARIGESYRFSVNNPGAMSEEIAAQIFKRSFSTKARRGRGLGTYSMKLFGERVLGGSVGFTSDEATGTTFFIDHPLSRRAH